MVHPESWDIVRLASLWREGVMPQRGGAGEQAAMTVACIDIVLTAWSKLRADRDRKRRKD